MVRVSILEPRHTVQFPSGIHKIDQIKKLV